MYRSMFFTYISKYTGLTGVNLVEPNFKITKRLIFWLTINYGFLAGSLYTFYAYDLETQQKSTTYFGLVLQVSKKNKLGVF